MSGIIWLASYPKSGNTWLRIFLSNLLDHGSTPSNINDLRVNRLSQDRRVFDEVVGLDSIDLTFEEIDFLRPEVYRFLASHTKQTLYIKCHDAYNFLPNGQPIFPPDISKAIYIIRNPLDVAVSYSFHIAESIDRIISFMGDANYYIGVSAAKGASVLNQQLSTWSRNVESWVDAPNMEVHVVRYEDLKAKPVETFTKIAHFSGLPSDEESIYKAIQFSDFRLLKSQEQQNDFKEMSLGERSFFREGRSGGWRDYLTKVQVERIIREHGEMMQRFDYLDEI